MVKRRDGTPQTGGEQPQSSETDLTVGASEAGQTLAAIVRQIHPDWSWNQARRLIRTGRVAIDGAACHEDARRLNEGERITTRPTATASRGPQLEASRILHIDRDIIVVDKPAGIVTAPFKANAQARGLHRVREESDTLVRRATSAIVRIDGKGQHAPGGRSKAGPKSPKPLGVVQRLDRGTTGVLVFARHRKAREALEDQIRKHEFERIYLALVHGRASECVYESFLVADRGDGKRGSWRGAEGTKPPKHARYAKTSVYLEEHFGDAFSFVGCQLTTGRQHQIRIHLAEAGHPLVGETVYGSRRAARPRSTSADASKDSPRPLLHAQILGFRHPQSGIFMRFESPVPADFQRALEQLRSGHRLRRE